MAKEFVPGQQFVAGAQDAGGAGAAGGWAGGEFNPQEGGAFDAGQVYGADGPGAYGGAEAQQGYGEVAAEWGAGQGVVGGWFELDCTPHSPAAAFEAQASGVTAVVCDRQEELVWAGDADGWLRSLAMEQPGEEHPPPPECHTSVRGHPSSVLDMCANRHGVLSVSDARVTFHDRGGLLKHSWGEQQKLGQVRACCFGDRDLCYVAGTDSRLLQLNLSKGQLMRDQTVEAGVSVIHADRSTVVCGGSDGNLVVRDTRTMKATLTLQAHTHSVLDLDAKANMVITCGYQRRFDRSTQAMGAAEDRFINVYDVRHTRRQLSQIPLSSGPYQLCFHPNFSSTVMVLSSTGSFQQCDVSGGQQDLTEYHIESEGDFVAAFDMSRSAEVLMFGDSGGFLHRWVDRQPFRVNSASQQTESPGRFPPPASFELDIDDPSASVPVVSLYPEDQSGLFSDMRTRDWRQSRVAQPPRTIGPDLLERVEERDAIGVVRPVPSGFVRNSTMGSLSWKNVSRAKAKAALAAFSPGAIAMAADGTPPPQTGGTFNTDGTALKRLFSPGQAMKMRRDTYERINLKIKQLEGVGGFQFEKFNRTKFTGLENALPNSYTNPLVQLLYFTPALRATMLNRLSQEEVCLCDELHFLFDMMDEESAVACFSNNFLRAFRQLRPALNLVAGDDNTSMDDRSLATRIVNCLQYLLEHLHKELLPPLGGGPAWSKENMLLRSDGERRLQEAAVPQSVQTAIEKAQTHNATVLGKLFSAMTLTVHTEPKSGTEWTREDNVFMHSMAYPSAGDEDGPACFDVALQRSLCKEVSLRTYVPGDNSKTPQRVHQKKVLAELPPILIVNCGFPADGESKTERLKWLRSRRSIREDSGDSADVRPMSMCRAVKILLQRSTTSVVVEEVQDPEQNTGETPRGTEAENSSMDEVRTPVERPPETEELYKASLLLDRRDLYRGLPKPEPEPQTQPEPEPEPEPEAADDSGVYKLTGAICLMHDPMKKESSHGGNIVAILNIPADTVHGNKAGWHVFNDFRIEPVSEEEALQLCGSWKIPCLLVYSRSDCAEMVPVPERIDHRHNLTAYMQDFTSTIARTMHERAYSFTPLAPIELERGNLVVAIDSEFVALSHEVTSTREDGSSVTIIPARFGLARVSVIRGDPGPLNGMPIMDHYISSPEPVADYLTRYSGVEPGDLDPMTSRHYVTTLKAAYLQLKWFTAAGCVFVGHGLKKDFRIINMTVAPSMVRDTAELFYMPNQRKISLRYLAWYFLNIDVQAGNHDSIEDARAALALYRKYEQLEAEGAVESAISKLYAEGHAYGFKVPDDGSVSPLFQASQ